MILVWLALLSFVVDYAVRALAQWMRQRKAADGARGEEEEWETGAAGGGGAVTAAAAAVHDATPMQEFKPISHMDIEAFGSKA